MYPTEFSGWLRSGYVGWLKRRDSLFANGETTGW